jgi:hypothetical protein
VSNSIQDTVTTILPGKRKTSPNNWISFNAPCCHHNGESADTRGRGGLMLTPTGGVAYHCFNCQFITGWEPGRHISYKFRKLLQWFGTDENTIKRLVFEALRIKDTIAPEIIEKVKEEFVVKPRPLPEEAISIAELMTFLALNTEDTVKQEDYEQLVNTVEYLATRKVNMEKYEFFITPETFSNMHKRVIVPFYWKGQVIGYTGRAIVDNVKPKYYNSYEANVVFNMDMQKRDSKFVLVMEGPFDAMAVDGVATLGDHLSEVQVDLIESLGKEVIVVPDFDIKEVRGKMVWTGERLVNLAIEYGWHVSFPIWKDKYKDVSKAVEMYGKLYTMKSILEGVETSKLKIELMKKRIHTN